MVLTLEQLCLLGDTGLYPRKVAEKQIQNLLWETGVVTEGVHGRVPLWGPQRKGENRTVGAGILSKAHLVIKLDKLLSTHVQDLCTGGICRLNSAHRPA